MGLLIEKLEADYLADTTKAKRSKTNMTTTLVRLVEQWTKCFGTDTGLVLQSLLVPLPRAIGETRMRLRFAHQVHQELFLALFVEDNRDAFRGVALPLAVSSLVDPSSKAESQA